MSILRTGSDTRTERFVSAFIEAESKGTDQASATLRASPGRWYLWKDVHPLDEYPIAAASGPYDTPPVAPNARVNREFTEATLILTATRTGADSASIDVSAGLDMNFTTEYEHRPHLSGPASDAYLGHLIHPVYTGHQTAPVHRGTAIARCRWKTAGTAPSIEAFRVVPTLGRHDELLLHLSTEMPTGWHESDPQAPSERGESVLSGWTTTPADTDALVLGIPWLQRNRELVLEFNLRKLHTAVAELKALVAPPPPPPPGDGDGGQD